MDAFSGLQDFFLIGAEPTMDPGGSAAKLRHADERGLPRMSITNGAVSVRRFEDTFGEALDSGLYKINISIDSMDPAVHNQLRGRSFALARTLEIVRHCLRRKAPLKIQFTVWPSNYSTIVSSVEELYAMGVRGFAFHAGSVEGVADPDRHGLAHVDPLAWRLLVQQLADWGKERPDLEHFNLPYLVFTERELRTEVIGDGEETDAYLEHVHQMEAGRESAKPVHVCPALAVPQVYVFANDGGSGHGQVSLCNIHPGAYADYQPDTREWRVIQDPERNQMQQMLDSPHLCPATPGAYGSVSDRFPTEAGDLFAACRYVGSNQMPDPSRFPEDLYPQAVDFYALVAQGVKTQPFSRILRVCAHEESFAAKTRTLAVHLVAEAD
ncbi:MAG: hypothetical protein M0026_14240 [Nocardiopsaceae bacterium]|nr:hypothetical protein [Nocardiopsaceae bacterium]